MHKQWLAMLSVIGLAGSAARVQGQVVKGSEPVKGNQVTKNTNQTKTSNSASKGKLAVNQQNLRQQNQGTAQGSQMGVNTTVTRHKGANNTAATTGNGNANNQLTKAKGQTQANNAALTKAGANNAPKANGADKNALTKAGLTKAGLTKAKNNSALTKAKTGAQ